jgi:NAD(P)-dependent dehydrogenase (short-subunit alcohol dehydrogenase family)
MQKFVIVTGCDSGFGKMLVDRLLSETSFGVIACYYSQKGVLGGPDPCSRLLKHTVDITSDSSVELLRKSVIEFLGDCPLVGIVNNAGGLLSSGPAEWTNVSVDQAQMDLNFIGTVRVTKAFLSLIRESKEGRIVNVSSILGIIASPLGAAYAASKFAVEGWSDSLRREMLPFGVRVSIIEPGMFRGTQFYKHYTTPVEIGWKTIETSVKDAYGRHYKDYVLARLLKVYAALGSDDPKPVVDAMVHALTSPRPHRRYRLGFDCVVLARILEWVPACISDLALTIADVAITRNRDLSPQMPARGIGKSWLAILWFSFSGYSPGWWIYTLVIAIVLLILHVVH